LSSCPAIHVCPLEVLFSSIGRPPETKGQRILWIECDRSGKVFDGRIDFVPIESRVTAATQRFSVVRVERDSLIVVVNGAGAISARLAIEGTSAMGIDGATADIDLRILGGLTVSLDRDRRWRARCHHV
jgi:hypothetical protein